MKQTTNFSQIAVMVILTVGLMFIGNFPSEGADSGKIPAKLQPVGIINPDGGKSVWLVPDDISEFLAGYSSQKIEGIKFYQMISWKDTATFMAAVNQHQEQVIRDLAVNMHQLTRRVAMLERTRVSAATFPANQRIEALEQKVREMTDGGYR
ncbi:MAG: hypothetical protein WBM69_07810 [Desulfobacterales bacterium]